MLAFSIICVADDGWVGIPACMTIENLSIEYSVNIVQLTDNALCTDCSMTCSSVQSMSRMSPAVIAGS